MNIYSSGGRAAVSFLGPSSPPPLPPGLRFSDFRKKLALTRLELSVEGSWVPEKKIDLKNPGSRTLNEVCTIFLTAVYQIDGFCLLETPPILGIRFCTSDIQPDYFKTGS